MSNNEVVLPRAPLGHVNGDGTPPRPGPAVSFPEFRPASAGPASVAAAVGWWQGDGPKAAARVALHLAAFGFIYFLSELLTRGTDAPPSVWPRALAFLPILLLVKFIAFLVTGNYRAAGRHATFNDLTHVVEGATLATTALVLLRAAGWGTGPFRLLVIDWAATVVLLGGSRGAARFLHERLYPLLAVDRYRRVLVVGSGDDSFALVRQIHGQPALRLRIVGVLDPDPQTHGRSIAGVRVVGSPADLKRHVARHRVEAVLAPTPAVPPQEVRSLVAACAKLDVNVLVVPGFDALLRGNVTVRPRDVEPADLLARDPVQLDTEALRRFLNGRVVLVTGAAGSIGSEICRHVLRFRPRQLVLFDRGENGLFYLERELQGPSIQTRLVPCLGSVTDVTRLREVFSAFRPSVVLHAAAHKHVPLLEANPGEGVKNNVLGTKILVDESVRAGAEVFVLISTDKAVNPSSVMGATKRLAEMYLQSLAGKSATRLVTVRFGNVLGSTGSVLRIFKEQIRNGGPLTVTHPEMTRYFMSIPEAAQLVLQAGALGHGGEIFALDMGKPVRVLDLGRNLIRLSGLEEGKDIDIVITGIRPGERLHEELYSAGEELLPTPHPKIFLAKPRSPAGEGFAAELDSFVSLADCPVEQVRAALHALVPEFRPAEVSTTRNGVAVRSVPVIASGTAPV